MSEELQARYEALEREKATLTSPDDRFRLTVIEQEQAAIREQLEDTNRLQRQAEAVAEIELPHDYDELWSVSGANNEIRNLIRQVKEQLFAAHNEELAQRAQVHKEQMDASSTQLASLNDTIQRLEGELEIEKETNAKISDDLRVTQDRLHDAESKRDNAVRLKEEAEAERDRVVAEVQSLKRQIDELEGMLRTYRIQASGGFTGGLKLTSTISPASKEDDLNRILKRRGLDPLPMPKRPEENITQEDIDQQSAAVEEAAAEAEHFQEMVSDDAAGCEVATGAEEVAEDVGSVSPPTTLEARVAALEEWRKKIDQHLFATVAG